MESGSGSGEDESDSPEDEAEEGSGFGDEESMDESDEDGPPTTVMMEDVDKESEGIYIKRILIYIYIAIPMIRS